MGLITWTAITGLCLVVGDSFEAQWCLDMGNSGQRRAGLGSVTCDGWSQCILVIYLKKNYCRRWRRAVHDAFVSCQAYAIRYLSCSQSPAMFVTRGPIAPPTPTAPSVLRSLPPITIHQNRQRVVGSVGHFLDGSRGSVDVFEIYNSYKKKLLQWKVDNLTFNSFFPACCDSRLTCIILNVNVLATVSCFINFWLGC